MAICDKKGPYDKLLLEYIDPNKPHYRDSCRQYATNVKNLRTHYAAKLADHFDEAIGEVVRPKRSISSEGKVAKPEKKKKEKESTEGNVEKKKALGEEGTEHNPDRKKKKKALGEEDAEHNPDRKKKKALGEEGTGLNPDRKKKKIHDQTPPTETQTGFLQPGPGNSNCPIVMQKVKALMDKCAKLHVIITPGKPQNLQQSDRTGDGHNKMPDSDEHMSLLDSDGDPVDTGDGDTVDPMSFIDSDGDTVDPMRILDSDGDPVDFNFM